MTERIAIVTAMRDEGPHLLHWIAHHRAAGVAGFLIFTNDCADGTDALLDLLAPAGVVHVRNDVPEGKTPQWSALKQAERHPALTEADWVAVIDCDEYVNLRAPLSGLGDLVAAVGTADAIVLPWRLFGSNGHVEPPGLAPTRAFTRAIPEDALYPPLSRFFKTLYRRDSFRAPGVHRPKARKRRPGAWVDGSGTPLPAPFAEGGQIMLWGAPLATGLVQLNHYSVRSAMEFLGKRARGLPNHTAKEVGLTYWVERNFNTVPDDTILRMEPATEAELARLRALPGVADAEAAARDWHDARRGQALVDPETAQLLGRLILAADSVPPDAATARRLVDLYRKALG